MLQAGADMTKEEDSCSAPSSSAPLSSSTQKLGSAMASTQSNENMKEQEIDSQPSTSFSSSSSLRMSVELLNAAESAASTVKRGRKRSIESTEVSAITDASPSTSRLNAIEETSELLIKEEFLSSSLKRKKLDPSRNMKEEEEIEAAPTTSLSASTSSLVRETREHPKGNLNEADETETAPSTSPSTIISIETAIDFLNNVQSSTSTAQETTTAPPSSDTIEQEQPQSVPSSQFSASSSLDDSNDDDTQSTSSSRETEHNTDSAPSSPCTPISTSSVGSDNTEGSASDDPPDCIRYDQRSHWCEWGEKSRCRFCKTQIPPTKCDKCDVNLCFNMKKNCFTAFHLSPEL